MNPKTLDSLIKGGFNSESDVKHFFTETRLLLERLGTHANEYKVIKFYADWMLHIKKENLKDMYGYFEECDLMLNKNEMLPDRHEFNAQMEKLTSFVELKIQLKKLLSKYGIETSFLDTKKDWTTFCFLLRGLILGKPIVFNKFKHTGSRRKMTLFVIDKTAPFMVDIPGAMYWMLFINTSEVPLMGVIPESVGLK